MKKELELTEEEQDFLFDISDFNGLKVDFEYKCCFSEEEAIDAALRVKDYDLL